MTFGWINQSNNTGNNTSTSVVVGTTNATGSNGSIAVGDLLIVAVGVAWATNGNANVPTISDGTYNSLYSNADTSWGIAINVWYKFATTTTASTPTVSWTNAATAASWEIGDWKGLSTLDAASGQETTSLVTSMTAPSLSPVGATDSLICIWMTGGGRTPYTGPGTMTTRSDTGSTNATRYEILVSDQVLTAAGATGTRVATMASGTRSYGVSMAFTPGTTVSIIAETGAATDSTDEDLITLQAVHETGSAADATNATDHTAITLNAVAETVHADDLAFLPVTPSTGDAIGKQPVAYQPTFTLLGSSVTLVGFQLVTRLGTITESTGTLVIVPSILPITGPAFYAAEISIQKPGALSALKMAVLSGVITAAGTSGTNGTFALGITPSVSDPATGTFTVASGHLTAITITHGGSGYSGAVTFAFTASAGLTGATGAAVMAATDDKGYGTRPIDSIRTDDPADTAASNVILTSDIGYRTLPTDTAIAGSLTGVQAYPPAISSAFQINRSVNLDPSESGIGASWGTISLLNVGNQWDALATDWNSDNRPVKIYFGNRILENFAEFRGTRASVGTYLDVNGIMRTASINVVRYDFSTGSGVLLAEPAATNLITDDTLLPSTIAGSTITVSHDVPELRESSTIAKCVILSGSDTVVAFKAQTPNTVSIGATITASVYAWVPLTANLTTVYSMKYESTTPCTPAIIDMTRRGQWVRYSVTFTNATGTGAGNFTIRATPNNVGQVLYLTCWQIEAGSVATSYIHTYGAGATRAVDIVYPSRRIWLDPSYSALSLVFGGVSQPWSLSDQSLDVPIRDATYWLERPLNSNQYGGAGGSDGVAALAGVPKPILKGVCLNITPTLVEPTHLIYQYNDGPGTIQTLYEGGAAVFTYDGDTAVDLMSGTPPVAGHYRSNNALGMFQMGSTPVHVLTLDATGNFAVAGAQTNIATIARYLMTEIMQLPAANINLTSFSNAATKYPYSSGVYFDSSATVDCIDALDILVESLGAKIIISRTGQVTMFVLRTIPANTTEVATFDQTNIIALVPKPLPSTLIPPPYRWRIGYGFNYTVQTSDLNSSTTAAHKLFIANASQYATASSATVLATFARPNDHTPLGGALTALADAQSVANDLISLWSTTRTLYTVTLPASVGVSRDLGDVVVLRYTAIRSLNSGVQGQIVAEAFSSTDATISFDVLV